MEEARVRYKDEYTGGVATAGAGHIYNSNKAWASRECITGINIEERMYFMIR